jgi:hypothetical protein
VIKSTTDCLEELHSLKSLSQRQVTPSSPSLLSSSPPLSQSQSQTQDQLIRGYEQKLKLLQESIDSLQLENDTLRARIETSATSSCDQNDLRRLSPVNFPSKNKPSVDATTGNSFPRKTPPLSARRLTQSSSVTYGSGSDHPPPSSPLGSPERDPRMIFPSGRGDNRRHSSYTTGDYVVSYAMKQNALAGGEEGDSPQSPRDKTPIITPTTTPKKLPSQEILTHPYYPHSASASILWQEAIAQQVRHSPCSVCLHSPLPRPSLIETF